MKRYLFPKEGAFYKANLHAHTTVSDGKMTPSEAKEIYKSNGYSVLAITDHGIMHPHKELNDDEFVVITGVEGGKQKGNYYLEPTTHFCLYAKDPDACTYPSFDPRWINEDVERKIKPEYLGIMRKFQPKRFVYGTDDMNRIIDECNKNGFLVCYNHPLGSLQNFSFYGGLKGLWGIECYNGNSEDKGYDEDMRAYDDILCEGERSIFPIASDDAHRAEGCFKGFVMIKAKALTYDLIMKALENGDFYASTGIIINDLYLENKVLHIDCDGADEITLRTPIRFLKRLRSEEKMLTSAEINIEELINTCKYNYDSGLTKNTYFRIDLKRKDGAEAHTKAFFLDEI